MSAAQRALALPELVGNIIEHAVAWPKGPPPLDINYTRELKTRRLDVFRFSLVNQLWHSEASREEWEIANADDLARVRSKTRRRLYSRVTQNLQCVELSKLQWSKLAPFDFPMLETLVVVAVDGLRAVPLNKLLTRRMNELNLRAAGTIPDGFWSSVKATCKKLEHLYLRGLHSEGRSSVQSHNEFVRRIHRPEKDISLWECLKGLQSLSCLELDSTHECFSEEQIVILMQLPKLQFLHSQARMPLLSIANALLKVPDAFAHLWNLECDIEVQGLKLLAKLPVLQHLVAKIIGPSRGALAAAAGIKNLSWLRVEFGSETLQDGFTGYTTPVVQASELNELCQARTKTLKILVLDFKILLDGSSPTFGYDHETVLDALLKLDDLGSLVIDMDSAQHTVFTPSDMIISLGCRFPKLTQISLPGFYMLEPIIKETQDTEGSQRALFPELRCLTLDNICDYDAQSLPGLLLEHRQQFPVLETISGKQGNLGGRGVVWSFEESKWSEKDAP